MKARYLISILLVLGVASAAQAGARDRAKRMYDRIVGVPPSEAVLADMAARIGASPTHAQLVDAAMVAIASRDFYNVSLVNFVTPWTNVEQTVFADLNDYTATVVGMVRDGVPFDRVLTADLTYVAAPGLVPTPYQQTSNQHYIEIQAAGLDLSNPAVLVGVPQSTLPGSQITAADAAGVITTRAAAEAFFSAGTNRRMWRFTAINYLCRDMEALKDTSRPTDRIRQDVNRSPGGDSEIFHTQCVGCHSGMDAVAGAFAYFEWDKDQGRMIHTPGQVQGKYAINTGVFPGGHITTDNSWINLWRQGQNAGLGWSPTEIGQGLGAKGLGEEVSHSRAFAECQVEKVFEHVCFKKPQDDADAAAVSAIATQFESNGSYDLRQVFADVAIYCTEGE
jgi:hypothetical protein